MNQIELYKTKGLSDIGYRSINIIRGCILGSSLENKDKRELCNFMNELEEYLEGD